MRILLLAYAFPPAASAEAWCSAKAVGSIPDAEVDVVAAMPLRARGVDHSMDDWVAKRFRAVRRIAIPQISGRIPLERLGPVFNGPDVYRFAARAARRAIEHLDAGSYDVLISRSQPHSAHLVASSVARRSGIPWVACFSDPWASNPFVRAGLITRALNERLERHVMNAADAIVLTSAEAFTQVLGDYGKEVQAKAAVIPHLFVPELYGPPPGGSREITIRHLGTFYGPRSPEPLLLGLSRLLERRSDQNVKLELVGPLNARHLATQTAISLHERGALTVRPPVDHVDALALMSGADILVTVDAPMDQSPFLPSKLVDYVGAGRPIVGVTAPGPARQLVDRLGGWSADPRDEAAVAAALEQAVAWVDAGRGATFGDPAVRGEYSSATVGSLSADVIIEAISRGRRR